MRTLFAVLVIFVVAPVRAEEPGAVASTPECPTTRLERPASDKKTTSRVSRASHTKAKPLSVRWSATVGRTTFRTTMAIDGGALVIGTHGSTLDGKDERDDGVYLLDARTGKHLRFNQTPGTGDRDVGGIALANGRAYFGTDNGQLVALPIERRSAWIVPLQGKVRPAPALGDLGGDGQLDVVVGDEAGVLTVASADDGEVRWTVQTGENEYGSRGFIAAAAIADVDGDGKDDVIAGARDGVLRAYRGEDGACLWALQGDSGIHASPTVADLDGDGRPEVLAAWSYGDVVVADLRTGAPRAHVAIEQDDGAIEGLFATPALLPSKSGGIIVAPTSWWEANDGVVAAGQNGRKWRSVEGRVSSSPVVADLDGDGIHEAIVGTEKGVLLSLSADGKRTVLAELKGAIEAPPMFADVDGDGRLELFVASNDGKLTCFSTSARTALISRFRGPDATNRGDLGAIALGWKLSPLSASTTAAATPTSAEWNALLEDVRLRATPTSLTATRDGQPLFSLCALDAPAEASCTAEAKHRLVSLVGQYVGIESAMTRKCAGAGAQTERRLRTIDIRTGKPVNLTTLFAERAVHAALNPTGKSSYPTQIDSFVIRDVIDDRAVVDLRLGAEEFRVTLPVPKALVFAVRAAKSGRAGFVEANAPGVRIRCPHPEAAAHERGRD